MPSTLLAAQVVPPDQVTPPEETTGAEGTLLAVVPIPGTGTSLAIVGYTVPTAPPNNSAATDRGLVIDHARRRVWLGGNQVELTYQEFELLAFLSAHPDQVFSRAELLAQVWGQLPKSRTQASTRAHTRARTRTVDVHVSRLRRKLGPVYGRCLTTEHRAGYRFDPASRSPA